MDTASAVCEDARRVRAATAARGRIAFEEDPFFGSWTSAASHIKNRGHRTRFEMASEAVATFSSEPSSSERARLSR